MCIRDRQLLFIPIVGLCFKKANFIYVDRRKGETNIQAMVNSAKRSMETDPRPLLIFPEGTRTPVGERRPYKYGVTALYDGLQIPCLPVAINCGYFWSRRQFLRYPGKMVIEFLEPIEAGLDKNQFAKRLYNSIEEQSDKFVDDLKFHDLFWRPRPESNWDTRICSPLRNHSATWPYILKSYIINKFNL